VIYDFRHTFATRKAESRLPVATLTAILGHADLRGVMKYAPVRQDATDRAMEQFEAPEAVQNISETKRSSVSVRPNPVKTGKSGDRAGPSRKV